jgi:hypothetical protein
MYAVVAISGASGIIGRIDPKRRAGGLYHTVSLAWT